MRTEGGLRYSARRVSLKVTAAACSFSGFFAFVGWYDSTGGRGWKGFAIPVLTAFAGQGLERGRVENSATVSSVRLQVQCGLGRGTGPKPDQGEGARAPLLDELSVHRPCRLVDRCRRTGADRDSAAGSNEESVASLRNRIRVCALEVPFLAGRTWCSLRGRRPMPAVLFGDGQRQLLRPPLQPVLAPGRVGS